MSISFYNQNAESFIESTITIDLSDIYGPFLELLPTGAKILDAGCGSGRDSKVFTEMGYQVTAFDASRAMVERACQFTGLEIQLRNFNQVREECIYDGIWACASLLHVPLLELTNVLIRLCKALKPSGICYASFKYGSVERKKDGRHFTDLNEPILDSLLKNIDGVSLRNLWITIDKRPDRSEKWLNIILQKDAKRNG